MKTLLGERFTIAQGAQGYPPALMELEDPPPLLYGIGNQALLNMPSLSIVGARKATPYGKSAAFEFATIAAEKGIVIVSGGALGCDSEAHRGALAAKGHTIVVLGGGCDQIYPPGNSRLFQAILDKDGLIISEQHWDFPPLPYTFRARNRIIAALSRVTFIVEAGLPSGTFSTADEALACNKEVFAMPGAITSDTSRGANRLIYQGAQPIIDKETFEDALSRCYDVLVMRSTGISAFASSLEHEAKHNGLLKALLAEPMRIETIMQLDRNEIINSSHALAETNNQETFLSEIMLALAQLEQKGFIQRYPDGRYGPKQVM